MPVSLRRAQPEQRPAGTPGKAPHVSNPQLEAGKRGAAVESQAARAHATEAWQPRNRIQCTWKGGTKYE